MELRFEWDEHKATTNRRKHGISFEEARVCSEDVLRFTTADEIGIYLRERYGVKLADLGITKFPAKRPSPF